MNTTSDNSTILLKNNSSNEVYSDLLTIHEVNIKHIDKQHSLELQILRNFFEIDTQERFNIFVNEYSSIPYGKLLLNNYEMATSDISLLDKLSEEAKFMLRLTEEQLFEAEEKGLKEGLKEGKKEGKKEVARNLLDILDIQTISKKTGLSVKEIESLKE